MELHVIIPAAGVGRRMGAPDPLPKSLRPVGGRPIVLHMLDALAARGMQRVTLVTGHGSDRMRATVGDRHRGVPVDYVVNEDYAHSEHGWSLYLAKAAWSRERRPAILVDADNVIDPRLLDRLLACRDDHVVMVDPDLDSAARDEELVTGRGGRVTGFVRGRAQAYPDCVGGFVGLNRFGVSFMQALFDFMDGFFLAHGRGFKYERIFDRLVCAGAPPVRYLDTGGLAWINVNHPEELAVAERIVASRTAS